MGVYVNPGHQRFLEAVSSEIYVDKTELIADMNRCLNTEQKYICVSRPRRFGKSMAANMLAAYYSRGSVSGKLFQPYRISADGTYLRYMNKYNVIFLNMQSFLGRSADMAGMLERISRYLLKELLALYPGIDYIDREDLVEALQSIYQETGDGFVFIIDEWDCIFRENLTVREFPAGKGFADIVYIPRGNHLDKPALVVELKWDKSARSAIAQIKNNQYPDSLAGFHGNILLVGVNYNKNTKAHECRIEKAVNR